MAQSVQGPLVPSGPVLPMAACTIKGEKSFYPDSQNLEPCLLYSRQPGEMFSKAQG